jgi:fatty-acyl-CoA synthase
VLRGRKKEMFIQGGYNVYPVEVENVLASHPAVAVVAGIGVHDQLLGEVGLYCVQLRPGAQATEHELRDFCAQRLADYKVPRHFAWPDVLPLTPAGKVSKSELKKRYG